MTRHWLLLVVTLFLIVLQCPTKNVVGSTIFSQLFDEFLQDIDEPPSRVALPSPPWFQAMDELRRARRMRMSDIGVEADDDEFERWIVQGYEDDDVIRPYGVVVLFRANTTGSSVMEAEFDSVSQRYWKALDRARNGSSSKLFFVKVDAKKAPLSFQKAGVSLVPSLAFVPPNTIVSSGSKKFQEEWFRNPSEDVSSLGSWVSQRAGVIIPGDSQSVGGILSTTDQSQMFRLVRVFFVLQMLGMFGSYAKYLFSKQGWMFVSLFFFAISVSGSFFCLLRGMPPFGYNPNQGGLYFVYPDRGGQFFFEGLLTILLTLAIPVGFISASEYVRGSDWFGTWALHLIENEQERHAMEVDMETEPEQEKLQRLAKNGILSLALAWFGWFVLWEIFKRKVHF